MDFFSLATFQNLYMEFLINFPPPVRPIISLLVAAAIVYAVIQIIRKDFIYLILLIVLLPASIPVLKNIFDTLVQIIRYLIPG